MSERGNFRGRGGSRGGGGDHRGGRGGGRGGGQSGQAEKPKKENILDLSKYMDKQINVKFNGGREGKYLEHAYQEILLRHGLASSDWHVEGLRSAHEFSIG